MKNETKRVVGIILPICFLAILFSCAIVSVANDMYAFVKPEREVTIVISEPCTLDQVSQILSDNDILNNPFCFTAYVKSKNKEDVVEKFKGEISLSSSMSYREILAVFI